MMNLFHWITASILAFFSAFFVDIAVATLPPGEYQHPCPHCGTTLHRFGLGYCTVCHKWVSMRFLVEFLFLFVGFLLISREPTNTKVFWINGLILVYLSIIGFIDIETHLIQHKVTLFGLLLSIFLGSILHGYKSTFVGGGIAILLMGAFYLFGRWYAKIKNQRNTNGSDDTLDEALGFGDVTLAAIIGLLLGHAHILSALVTGILLAGLYSLVIVIMMAVKKEFDPEKTIPYGPFLIIAALVFLLPM